MSALFITTLIITKRLNIRLLAKLVSLIYILLKRFSAEYIYLKGALSS